jgi:phosphatidate cytidylyltransferase
LNPDAGKAQPKPVGSLTKRILSTFVGVTVFLLLCFSGQIPFAIGVTIVTALGVAEFVKVYHRAQELELKPGSAGWPYRRYVWLNPLTAWLGVGFPVLAYFFCNTRWGAAAPYAGVLASLVGLFAAFVARAAHTGKALGRLRIIYGLVGYLYIGTLFSSFVLLRGLPGRTVVPPFGEADRGAWVMLFVSVCVWATDTFAYFIGKTLGRHKLAPSLSPGKTIEGSIAGLVGAIAVGAAFGLWIHLPVHHGLIIGAMAGSAGQVGDLFKSVLKREIGIKDFGDIMPGHGGVLDRADSLLFVAPLAYLYLHLFAGL